jgi:septal ring factor EnvC (AmiA/AmiB activator)
MEWIPWTISAVSLLIAFLTFMRNTNNDSRERLIEDNQKMDNINQSLIKVNMKLDQACNTINELRIDIKSLNTSVQDLDRRVTILERDLKTAFTRIDELRDDKK